MRSQSSPSTGCITGSCHHHQCDVCETGPDDVGNHLCSYTLRRHIIPQYSFNTHISEQVIAVNNSYSHDDFWQKKKKKTKQPSSGSLGRATTTKSQSDNLPISKSH